MLIYDNETDVDFLYYESIANTIKNIIEQSHDNPVTIGIHGDWGAGKSSILKMIETNLSKEESKICLRFNGWLFQGFEDAKIVLMESIITSLQKNKKFNEIIKEESKNLLKRIEWIKLAKLGGNIAINLASGMPTPDQINGAINLLKTENPIEQIPKILSFLKPLEEKNIPEEMHAFRKDFEELLNKAKIDKLVVLVDDLDRCLPETAIETLEAIRLFLLVPKTTFIIAADEGMIEFAVKNHFPYIPNNHGLSDYSKNYLEKLIQIPFRIPSLGISETRTYITLSLIEQYLEPDDFNKVLKKSKELLQKPWDNSGISRQDIENTGIAITTELDELIFLSDQISPILSEGTKGNPRQIKRFLNSLLLRIAVSKNRHLDNFINKNTLAKLMLLESFKPNFYDFVASNASATNDGICKDIKNVEDKINGSKNYIFPKGLEEFQDDEWVKKWFSIKPFIGKEDLRPYVFISKDKKTGLFLNTSNEKIERLFSVLLKTKFVINSNIEDIKNLSTQEVLELFNLVSNKIKEHKNWSKEPPGYQGIKGLIKHHSFMQKHFINLLKTFDGSKVSFWVKDIEDMNLTKENEQEITELFKEWHKNNEYLDASAFAI